MASKESGSSVSLEETRLNLELGRASGSISAEKLTDHGGSVPRVQLVFERTQSKKKIWKKENYSFFFGNGQNQKEVSNFSPLPIEFVCDRMGLGCQSLSAEKENLNWMAALGDNARYSDVKFTYFFLISRLTHLECGSHGTN